GSLLLCLLLLRSFFCCARPPLLFPLLLYSSRHHRYLHSFPTRRSSDLEIDIRCTKINADYFLRRIYDARRIYHFVYYYRMINPRSEEHTSELQSRFDLVCRLLLEKKKGRKER